MTRERRGFAMAMVLFIIALLSTLCFGAVNYSTMDGREALQACRAASAVYAARAGIADSVSQLEFNYNLTAVGSPSQPRDLGPDGGTYYCTITPGPGNANTSGKIWKVVSTGSFQGAVRTLEAYVELESFAKYVYFTDAEYTATGQEIWFFSGDSVDGPTHSNGFFRISGNPRFSDRTTSANQGDGLFNPSRYVYNQGGTQTDPARFYRYFPSGRGYATHYPVALAGSPSFSFSGGQPELELPANTSTIRTSATKAYRGTRFRFTFQSSASTGTVRVEKQVGSLWQFVENVDTTTLPGVTLHVDGVLEMSGTVKGRVTVGATQDIRITNDLVYRDERFDLMGIVSERNIVVVSSPYSYRDRRIQASMVALNSSFTVERYAEGGPRGTLRVLGGIVQRNRGPVGTFSGNRAYSGYTKDYRFDERLLATPPLNFPTTGNVIIRSLLDRGALGST